MKIVEISGARALPVLIAAAVLTGCTVAKMSVRRTNSNFVYPNSNVVPLGHVSYEAPASVSVFMPTIFEANDIDSATQKALAQKGGDILVNERIGVKIVDIPLPIFTVFLTYLRIEGDAAKMTVGKKVLTGQPEGPEVEPPAAPAPAPAPVAAAAAAPASFSTLMLKSSSVAPGGNAALSVTLSNDSAQDWQPGTYSVEAVVLQGRAVLRKTKPIPIRKPIAAGAWQELLLRVGVPPTASGQISFRVVLLDGSRPLIVSKPVDTELAEAN